MNGMTAKQVIKMGWLMRSAEKSAKLRGHTLGLWDIHTEGGWNRGADAMCDLCGMEVSVRPTPAPNDIDISGEAVALDCRGRIIGENV